MLDQAGDADWDAFRVVVIGCGVSGILMGIKLQEMGVANFTIYEKSSELGGTWRENTYPGIACDVASHHYCYSFAPNPEWSRRFPPGPEIKRYLEGVAEKHDVRRFVRFNTEIASARWADGAWRLVTKDGVEDRADVLISAVGVLHHPRYPDIDGLQSFDGPAFHTACWDHSVDLAGKRVGVIGTGSTASQIVPKIIDEVSELVHFQRTAQWMHPLPDKEYKNWEKAIYRHVPYATKAAYEFFRYALQTGFGDVVVGERDPKVFNKACMDNLMRVKDPALRAKLTPDYTPGCKRIIFSTDYYDAIQKPNAALETDKIAAIEPAGVRLASGELRELDVLVLATGFQSDRFMRPIEMVGEEGATLDEMWATAPYAYRSIGLPNFPNFFMMAGPNGPFGNLSYTATVESQAVYVMKLMERIRREKIALAPSAAATKRLGADMREAFKKTVWVTGCNSWYLNDAGFPALYPWREAQFHREMRREPDYADFSVAPLPAAEPALTAAE